MKAMRREIEGSDVAAAPVVSDCGRSASRLSTGLPGMTPNPPTIWAALLLGCSWESTPAQVMAANFCVGGGRLTPNLPRWG